MYKNKQNPLPGDSRTDVLLLSFTKGMGVKQLTIGLILSHGSPVSVVFPESQNGVWTADSSILRYIRLVITVQDPGNPYLKALFTIPPPPPEV